MKSKYSAKFIKIESHVISNETGEIVTPTSEEKLLDAIYGGKFTVIQLFTHVASAKGRTKRDVIFSHADFLEFAPAANNIHYELFFQN